MDNIVATNFVVGGREEKEMKPEIKIEKLLEPRQVEYKRIKMSMPHCPVCKEMLRGNNSHISPYTCSCGTWESDWMNPLYFKIKVNPL